jgi:hypothetical protein
MSHPKQVGLTHVHDHAPTLEEVQAFLTVAREITSDISPQVQELRLSEYKDEFSLAIVVGP